ncbi:oligosaccharide flippase family protein [Leptothermofonsia sp. ETS-13]|uniref:oligosaccharide flippase family protein n=1 Tax=Leptothermofonsia sp. ETS-13 TaxID=3035696 RepID=UPI003BA1C139
MSAANVSSSLKNLAIRGTLWTFVGYGAGRILSFGSQLVLTRLLAPEVFGLMALVNTFLIGLQLFSDVGIGPSIIQNDRGDEPEFLNTAWTIQVIRGVALWLCACIGAWPFAQFYEQPELFALIIVSGLSAVISGFNSTSLFTANRQLTLGRLTLIELVSQAASLVVVLHWVLHYPNVWGLVAGSMFGVLVKMILSYRWLPGIHHQFTWDWKAVQSLTKFGRWIFLSTALGFFLQYADRLVLGKFLSISELGIYSLAVLLAGVIQDIHNRVNQNVLLPVYSKLKHIPIEELRRKVRKLRLAMMAVLLPPIWVSAIFGTFIIDWLFDSRYHQAGWMFQVLSAGLAVSVSSIIGPFFLAFGDSFTLLYLLVVRSIALFGSMIAGALLYDTTGLICGIAIHNLVFYPFLVAVYRKYSLWIPWLDALGMLSSAVIITAGLYLVNTHVGG